MDSKVQVNARLDRQLWKEVKMLALQKDVSAASILEDAVRIYMRKPTSSPAASPVSPASDPTEVEQFVLDNADRSARQVADMLNEQGFTSARGGKFNLNIVGKIRQKLQ